MAPKSTGGPKPKKRPEAVKKGTGAKSKSRSPKTKTWRVAHVFSQLDGTAFAGVVNKLLDAEREASKLSSDSIEMTLLANRGDQGVDAFLKTPPPTATSFLPATPTVFQFKRNHKTAKAISKEVSNSPELLQLLKSGCSYRLVSLSDISAGPERDQERKLLQSELKKLTNANVDADVVPADDVRRWLQKHRVLWRYIPGAPPVASLLKDYAAWTKDQASRDAGWNWFANRERTEALKQIQARSNALGKRVFRISGPPGVGKTRLVFEAIKILGVPSATSYLSHMQGQPVDIASPWHTAVGGLLVVDECDLKSHSALSAAWEPEYGVLITVGSEDDRQAEPPADTIWLDALDPKSIRAIANAATSPLQPDQRERLAEASGGYPKLLRVLFDAVAEKGSLSATNLTAQELRVLVRRYLATDQAPEPAISVLALPRHFSVARDSAPLAQVAGFGSPTALNPALARLNDLALLGYLPNDGRYVTPGLLADYLAEDFWEPNPCAVLATLAEAKASASLIASCLARLARGTAKGVKVLESLFTNCRDQVVAQVDNSTLDSLLLSFANGNPSSAREAIRNLSERYWSSAAALALARCAWEPGALADSVEVLADALTRHDSGPGADHLVDLFGTVLGSSQADAPERLSVLSWMVRHPNQQVRQLAVRCVREACAQETGRFVANPSIDLKRNWRPATRGEEHAYRAGAATLLTELARDSNLNVRTEALHECVQISRGLFRLGFSQIAVQLVSAFVEEGGELAAARQVFQAVEQFDLPKASAQARKTWLALRPLLEPKTTRDRIIAIMSESLRRERVMSNEQLRSVASEFLSAPDRESLLDLLFSREGFGAFEFGGIVSHVDSKYALLEVVVRRSVTGASLRFASGYLLGVPAEPLEELLDRLAVEKPTSLLAFETTWLGTPSPRGADRFIAMIQRSVIEPERWEQLVLGGWLLRVELSVAARVVSALIATPVSAFRLAFQLASEHRDDPLLEPIYFQSWTRCSPSKSDHFAWEWRTAGEHFLKRRPAEVTARAIRLFADAVRQKADPPEEIADLVGAAVASDPRAGWREVVALLDGSDEEAAFRVAFDLRSHLAVTAAPELLNWVGADVKRARQAARLVTYVIDTEDNLGAALLDRFPNDQALAAILRDTLFSGNFHSEVDFWTERLDAALTLAKSRRPGLGKWARQAVPLLRERLAAATEVQKAFDEGILDIPIPP